MVIQGKNIFEKLACLLLTLIRKNWLGISNKSGKRAYFDEKVLPGM